VLPLGFVPYPTMVWPSDEMLITASSFQPASCGPSPEGRQHLVELGRYAGQMLR
jgi:hypothetical protein